VVSEHGVLHRPALLIHGGAGTWERLTLRDDARPRTEQALAAALDAGWQLLCAGPGALAAAVAAVASMEDSGLFNAGRGATLTSAGRAEMDAAVMDGASRRAGAVCAVTWPANPVKLALLVATSFDWPGFRPVLVAGPGADGLAQQAGLAPMGGAPEQAAGGQSADGTVGAVALDSAGHLAVATSTGGREGQPPGRVGDSPVIGAGTWADDGSVAVSATGTGEAFLLAGFGHRVDWAVRAGEPLSQALSSALDAVFGYGGSGGAIALAPSGKFATIFDTLAMGRAWRDPTCRVVRL